MTRNRTPLMVIISGPSGAGKDAVLERMRLLPREWHFIITATTRERRTNERDGTDYVFMTTEEFRALVEKDGFLEHAEVYGRWYGVPQLQVEEALRSGKDCIVKVDIQGARTIRAEVPDALLIFLAPPDMEELERRLRERKSESVNGIKRRIDTARMEMEQEAEFDYVVVNHNGRLDDAVTEVDEIIAREKRRRG
jgi:guanylate kinase